MSPRFGLPRSSGRGVVFNRAAMVTSKSAGCRAATLSREPFPDGAIRHDTNRRREGAYVNVKLTVTVTIASKPIGVYVHCLTASIAACANTPFVDRKTVTLPIVPSA